MSDAILKAEGVCFGYKRDKAVLSGVSLSFKRGELTGIIGPNGSGKTTLIKLLSGALRPSGGCVTLDGRDVQLNSIGAGECFGICNLLVAEPLQTVLRCAEETGAIIAAEEHSVIGGLGGAVAECLSKAGAGVPTEMVGVQDTFTESGPYNQLLKKYALDGAAVADAIRRAVGRKK